MSVRPARPLRVALVLAVLIGGLLPAAAQAATVTVHLTDGLSPRSITVAPGTTVRWTNDSDDRHRMRSRNGPVEFDSGNIEPGESFAFTFGVVGTYPYLDDRERDDADFHGTVIVAEASTGGGSGSGSGSGGGGSGGGAPAPAENAPASATVRMAGRTFSPGTVTIAAGGNVTFVNDDDREHTATGDAFDTGVLASGSRSTKQFPSPGTFSFLCRIHPDMRGTVSVPGAAGAAPPPAPGTPVPATPAPTAPPPAGTDGAVAIVDFEFDHHRDARGRHVVRRQPEPVPVLVRHSFSGRDAFRDAGRRRRERGGRATRGRCPGAVDAANQCPSDRRVPAAPARRDDRGRRCRCVRRTRRDERPTETSAPLGGVAGRQLHDEPAAAVAVRLEPDAAAHRVHQPPRREQPDPRAAAAAATVDPDERLEDALPVLDRDAGSVVGDVGPDRPPGPPDADADAIVGRGVLRLVVEELLEDLLEPRGIADRDERLRRALPADRVRAEQQSQRLDGLVDRRDRVERAPGKARQSLAANGREDRVDEVVEPRDLVERRRLPLAGGRRVGGRAARAARRTPGPRPAASAARGSRPTSARPAPRRARSAPPGAPPPPPGGGPSRRCRRAAPRSSAAARHRRRRTSRRSRVWTFKHADDPVVPDERHRQHRVQALHVEAADPGEPRILRDVLDRDRLTRLGDAAGDPLADSEADPARPGSGRVRSSPRA